MEFILYSIYFEIFLFWNAKYCNTRHRHESVFENDSASYNHDSPVKLEENIINTINNLNKEIVNLKDIVIKGLQDENENSVQNVVLWKTKWKP